MGEVLDMGSTVLCPHGGIARPVTANRRVLSSGLPIATLADQFVIDGCPNSTPAGPLPCVAARFATAASRVRLRGVPVLLRDSIALCEPGGASATVAVTQSRVIGA
jgi:uncharacterized Zn-binding protein involved in type VI secretion